MTEKVKNTIMQTKEGIFEVYEIDRQAGKAYGYKLFADENEKTCRAFNIDEVKFETLRK